MLEHVITASVLILALLVVRKLFWNTLSRRVQYALWGLVLLRLLIPWNLPAAQFSVLNAAAPVQQAVEQRLNPQEISRPNTQGSPNTQGGTEMQAPAAAPNVSTAQAGNPSSQTAPAVAPTIHPQVSPALSLTDVLFGVWVSGVIALALFFALTNLRFALRVLGCRKLYREKSPGHPAVYLVPEKAVPSPCLFGSAIYVTPTVLADPERLRMVLLHEETHARHWDPLWSLLRCLCLTIWWFNPLVWAAAISSRTDCELACDESVLRHLNGEDSYQYGQTLLSLVHVNGAGNPLCAATAMSAGARQLKERIHRIVRPRQVAAATLAVLLLTCTIGACTFTGGTASLAIKPASPDDADTRTLSDQEIRWFNEVFFNGEGGINIHNQFANPLNLYEKPQDINLFDLLYVHGYGQVPAEEYEAAFDEEAPSEIVEYCWKITRERIDSILQDNMGLTLDDTAKNGLDSFAYAPAYDAYYWFPGGTNWTAIDVQYGTQTGNQVTLYHYSDFDVSGWYAVTLEGQADGSWHFLSNVACDAPAIPVQLPDQEPIASIPLGDLTPYEAPALSLTPAPDGTEYMGSGWSLALGPGGTRTSFAVYRTPDGTFHAGISQADASGEDGPASLFLDFSDDSASLQWFSGLAGDIQGIQATYHAPSYQGDPTMRTDYITVREDGTPVLLARTDWTGTAPFLRDVNGDGVSDIAADGAVFLARDGALCRVDMDGLLQTALPEITFWGAPGSWDPESRLYSDIGATADDVQCIRTAAIVEDTLQIWGDIRAWSDHMPAGTADRVPEDVIATAKDWLSNRYLTPQEDGTWRFPDGEGLKPADDWRLESFGEGKTWYAGDETFEGWCITFGAHVADPESLFLVGDQYMEEDNWAHIGRVWLLFRLDGDTRTFLTTDRMGNDEDPGWADFLLSISEAQKTSASITRN